MCEIKDLYLDTFKSKISIFNQELYQDLKEQVKNVLIESMYGSIQSTQLTISNTIKETETFKFFVFELKTKGIQLSVEPSSYDVQDSILKITYYLEN